MKSKTSVLILFTLLVLAAGASRSRGQLVWQLGKDDDAWPQGGVGGGPNASFVQENGSMNDLPGDPASPVADRQADNDYYFAGSYTTTIDNIVATYADYTPVGTVSANEDAAERAFAGADNDWRVHFNLPSTLKTNDLLAVTWNPYNLDTSGTDPRYGVEVYFNGFLVQTQIVVRGDVISTNFTTPLFSLAGVHAQVGPGFDNIVSLKGINYSSDGGGSWMGIDYAKLNATPASPTNAPPALPQLWTLGLHDNGWPAGTGGGANASFVAPDGTINPLPGSATTADNDYYFTGSYSKTISSVTDAYGDYTPVGTVATTEASTERGFSGADNDLRVHFNLPSTLRPFDLLSVSFAGINLDPNGTDPHYGVTIAVNGVPVQPQILLRSVDLGRVYTTAQFRLDSVNAQVGSGFDNVLSLQGANDNADGGGDSLGIDFVQMNAGASSVIDTNPPTVLAVTRYGDIAKLKVTFSEPLAAASANVISNYTLAGGQAVTAATLQPDGTNVLLTTAPMPVGTTNALTVTNVKDSVGNPMSATGTPINFTTKNSVLFVTADPGPLTFAGDQAVLQRLQARGFDVTLTTGTAVPDDGSTGIGKDLVIVSSSLTPGSMIAAAGGAKFLQTPVPVIVWESSLVDDFNFQSAAGNTIPNQTQIKIIDSTSPLAAGLPSGLATVTTSPQTFSYGTPVGAHIIATSTSDPTQAVIFYYEKGDKGAATNSFTMPARRVFFFLQDNTASALNSAGQSLFDAAVDFALPKAPTPSNPTLPMIWTCGTDDEGWPAGTGGGANTAFVQENGSINPVPGAADSPAVDQQADNDYYFAGDYSTTIPSVVALYGDYTPVGTVSADEEAAERAFAGNDNDLRYHFNLPPTLKSTDALSVTFDPLNLDTGHADSRYGIAVYVNGVLVQPEIVIRPPDLNTNYTTPTFSLASVNAQTGPGADNIVSLKGVNYGADGGGAWMGFDYIQLNGGTPAAPSEFKTASVNSGNITLTWTGTGALESAASLQGPWTPVSPAPTTPYSEAIVKGQNRFYRLRQ